MNSTEKNTQFLCDNCGYVIFSVKTSDSGNRQLVPTESPIALEFIDPASGKMRAFCRKCGESKEVELQIGPTASAPTSRTPPPPEKRRIKFREATNHTRPDLAKELANKNQRQNSAFLDSDFHRVVDVFIQSVERINWLVLYPLTVGHINARDQLMQCIATFNHSGNPEAVGLGALELETIKRRAQGLSRARVETDFEKALDRIAQGIDDSDVASNGALGHAAEAIFSAQIVQAWSAFETLAGDLWESAINLHPKSLAALPGAETRIEKAAHTSTSKREEQSPIADGEQADLELSGRKKQIDLERAGRLTAGTYNLGGKMGTLLKPRFKFTTLTGIRRAYSAAFSKRYGPIDLVLCSKSLDACMCARNLIVHKGGIADQVYIDDSLGIPGAPKLAIKEQFALDGIVSRNLIDPVIHCGKNLIIAVDDWIADARGGDEQKRSND